MDRNELDPSVPSATEVKKIPLIIKVYAVLCILSGGRCLYVAGHHGTC